MAMLMGLLLGATGSKLGGTRHMLYTAPVLGVAAALGALTAYDWSWVGLLAGTGVLAGAGKRFGWFPALLMIPFAVTFVTPVPSTSDAAIYGAIILLAALYGLVLARRFGAPAVVEAERFGLLESASVAIVFGAILGGSASVGVALGWTEPYWVPEPVLILVLYITLGKRERIQGKALGTLLGVAGAAAVAFASPAAWVLTILAAAAFLLALTQVKRYWLMYGLYTFALVLVLAAPGQVAFEAEERGVQILIGIGLLVVGLAILHFLSDWLTKRYPQPELA